MITKGIVIKNKTIDGDIAHQYFFLSETNGENILLIEKLILTNEDCSDLPSCSVVRKFKEKYVIKTEFAIRVETLKTALEELKL